MCCWSSGLGWLVLLPGTSECFEHSEMLSLLDEFVILVQRKGRKLRH